MNKPQKLAASTFFLVFLISCSNPVGTTYSNVDALTEAEEFNAWVVVGSFGPNGPFKLVETNLCPANMPCDFTHNGQGHTYDGFDDFELMVLRLESAEGLVSHVVLRGKEPISG